jgi:hypothetical protein
MQKEIEDRTSAMPVADRIAFWIGQLDKLAAGEECEASRIGVDAEFPLDQLVEIGKEAVIPLLRLACKWADQPEWDNDDEKAAKRTPMADVILWLLWRVKDLGHADRQIERLLREFLKRSCAVNEGRSLWGTLPVHCADCLHELFDRYPESKMAGNNALENRTTFLRMPMP